MQSASCFFLFSYFPSVWLPIQIGNSCYFLIIQLIVQQFKKWTTYQLSFHFLLSCISAFSSILLNLTLYTAFSESKCPWMGKFQLWDLKKFHDSIIIDVRIVMFLLVVETIWLQLLDNEFLIGKTTKCCFVLCRKVSSLNVQSIQLQTLNFLTRPSYNVAGENCCLNGSRFDLFFEYEPHPSSAKNLHHLFQSTLCSILFSFMFYYTMISMNL